ncbi:MAG TPA: hypothetical protein VG734_22305 [Lacunisphaera sp.]|nr:hypothetical protein [Lacunisphaera sp.]
MNQSKTKIPLALACGLALLALPAAKANEGADKFKMMDSDGDGRITRAEHAAGAHTMFGKMDANNDGIVTAEEMDASHHEQKSSKLKFWEKKDKDMKSSAEKISVIDTNHDGQLTRAEHEAGSEAMFTRMDTNNDGVLSKDECEAGEDLKKK